MDYRDKSQIACVENVYEYNEKNVKSSSLDNTLDGCINAFNAKALWFKV